MKLTKSRENKVEGKPRCLNPFRQEQRIASVETFIHNPLATSKRIIMI